jgi:hypothetical protein
MTDNITLPRATVVQALETQAASKEDMKVYRSIVDNYWKGLAAKAEQQAEPVADGDKVICPACCHQFRGIPETVQTLMLHAGFEPPFTTPPQQQAEPVQEPVARVIDNGTPEGATEWIPFTNRVEPLETGDLLYTAPPQQQAEPVAKLFGSLPVYDTTPPQRKELSASEILNMMPSTIPAEYDGELMEFARAVEAKLKERNGY